MLYVFHWVTTSYLFWYWTFLLCFSQVKNHIWVFINCLIENPTFDSQTKENMTLQPKSFGSKCQLSEKFFKAVSIIFPELLRTEQIGFFFIYFICNQILFYHSNCRLSVLKLCVNILHSANFKSVYHIISLNY